MKTGPRTHKHAALCAEALVAVALLVVLVVGVACARATGSQPTAVIPSPTPVASPSPAASPMPVASLPPTSVLGVKYSASYDFVTPSLGWALVFDLQNPFAPLPVQSSHFWVFKTTDGAKSWRKQLTASIADVSLGAVQFFDQTNGIISLSALFKVVMYRTADGGEHWRPIQLPNNTTGYAFADPTRGWVWAWRSLNGPDDTPRLLSTTDGGQTWTPKSWTSGAIWAGNGILGEQHFHPNGEGWFGYLGLEALVYSTPDGGDSWLPHAIPLGPGLFPTPPADDPNTYCDVVVLPHAGVVAVVTGGYGRQRRFTSFDHGLTWKLVATPPNETPYSHYLYVDDKHWWSVGSDSLFKTSDAGQSWTRVEAQAPLENWIYSPHIIDAGDAWAQLTRISTSATDTALVMSTDGGVNWTGVNVPNPSLAP